MSYSDDTPHEIATTAARMLPHTLTKPQIALLTLTDTYAVLTCLRDIPAPRRSYHTNRVIIWVLEKLSSHLKSRGRLDKVKKYEVEIRVLGERVAIQEYWYYHDREHEKVMEEVGDVGVEMRREIEGVEKANRREMRVMLRRLGNPGVDA